MFFDCFYWFSVIKLQRRATFQLLWKFNIEVNGTVLQHSFHFSPYIFFIFSANNPTLGLKCSGHSGLSYLCIFFNMSLRFLHNSGNYTSNVGKNLAFFWEDMPLSAFFKYSPPLKCISSFIFQPFSTVPPLISSGHLGLQSYFSDFWLILPIFSY